MKGEVSAAALPEITYRQLEVFSVTCKERSYANAALELHSTRANIKRVCVEFERAVGRQLFEEKPDRTLVPTAFALGLLVQVGPLSRSLRKLGEGVRGLHQEGRILRFAAAGEFFRGGLFTEFLSSLKTSDLFRSCFVRIEVKRFRTALLNAECDVYFGIGLGGVFEQVTDGLGAEWDGCVALVVIGELGGDHGLLVGRKPGEFGGDGVRLAAVPALRETVVLPHRRLVFVHETGQPFGRGRRGLVLGLCAGVFEGLAGLFDLLRVGQGGDPCFRPGFVLGGEGGQSE